MFRRVPNGQTRRVAGVGLGVAVIAAAGAVGAGTAAAQSCKPVFASDGTNYISRLCGMPDYDQRRTAGILQGDGRKLFLDRWPLRGDGSCHCVPTSFTNLLGYYVTKGVVGSYPQRHDWDGREGYVPRPGVPASSYLNGQPYSVAEAFAYDSATETIQILGIGVKTGSGNCGTSWKSVLKYFNHWQFRKLFPKVQLSTTRIKAEVNAPKDVANALAAGGTVAMAYGRYASYGEDATGQYAAWGARGGGHAVTVRSVNGTPNKAQFDVSDPATNADPMENGDRDRFRQSRFASQGWNAKLVYNPYAGARWRMGAITSSGRARILDSLLIVYPTVAIVANGSSLEYVYGGLSFNNQGTMTAKAAQSRSIPQELTSKTFSAGAPVLDAAFLPASGEIAYLTRGSGLIRAVAVGTGVKRTIGRAPNGARQLEIDPTGQQIFVGGSTAVVRMDRHGKNVTKITLPTPLEVLAFDPGRGVDSGRIVSITTDGILRRHIPATLAAENRSRIARTLTQGSGALAASFDSSGKLVLRRGASNRIVIRGATTRRRKLPTLGGAGGLAIGDRGTLITVVDGKLAELSQRGSAVANSPLTGRPVRGRVLQVTRSGSDVPAEQANETIDQRVIDPDFPEMAP